MTNHYGSPNEDANGDGRGPGDSIGTHDGFACARGCDRRVSIAGRKCPWCRMLCAECGQHENLPGCDECAVCLAVLLKEDV